MREQNFLIDQRTTRKMVIGTVDIDVTNQMRNSMKRKLSRQKSPRNLNKKTTENHNISFSSTSSEYDSDNISPKPSLAVNIVPKNKPTIPIDYALLSKTCDRYRVSDRAGAAMASVILHNTVSSEIIDKNKLR